MHQSLKLGGTNYHFKLGKSIWYRPLLKDLYNVNCIFAKGNFNGKVLEVRFELQICNIMFYFFRLLGLILVTPLGLIMVI